MGRSWQHPELMTWDPGDKNRGILLFLCLLMSCPRFFMMKTYDNTGELDLGGHNSGWGTRWHCAQQGHQDEGDLGGPLLPWGLSFHHGNGIRQQPWNTATLASLSSSSVILGRGTRDDDLGGGLSSAAGRPQSPLSMWTLSLG